MLQLIRIRNYAVIDELEVEFGAGLSVMTGETGAGKSILVDALGLALGDRADSGAVRAGAARAEISVLFECPAAHPALEWLGERELDTERECLLRRTVSAEGRSRAFVNNQPVTLADLRTLGALLVDIHGQHAHQSLTRTATQRALLDAHGGLEALAAETAEAFAAWQQARQRLEAEADDGADRAARLELLRFQARELAELGLAEGELAELEAEHGRLANMDQLGQGIETAVAELYERETGSAYAQIVHARQLLEPLVEHDPALAEPARQLAGVEIELREAAVDLVHYRDRLEPDPERLEIVAERLGRIRTLARRHHVEEAELHAVLPALEREIAELEAAGESTEALEQRVQAAEQRYTELAGRLSAGRREAGAALGDAVTAQLAELGLPNGRLAVSIEPKAKGDATGLDAIELEVQLNPGQPFGPLSRVASGGELSRISLALEVVATRGSSIPTLVFDEVDAGIGGGVAEIVGRRLKQIADDRQVLCVTHLPQVASQGAHHYRVVKLTDGSASRTSVRRLGGDERVEELSRMLGGVEITAATRAHAEEMIRGAAK